MEKWFESQSRIIQILLLLIPGLNWVIEILVTFFGLAFGWLDLVWCLLFKHLIFCD